MKRRTVLSAFAVTALALSSLAGSQWLQLRERQAINLAVANVPDTLSIDEFRQLQAESAGSSAYLDFARATALMRGGNLEQADTRLASLANDSDDPVLADAAQYNLANGYLRAALDSDRNSGSYRSLIELAKQRYRDLLQDNPAHWDARYNLELAVRMVPEKEVYDVDDRGKPIKSVSVVFPGFEDRELP